MNGDDERMVLVDASVFITLAEIEAAEYLYGLRGAVTVPDAVEREISGEPAATILKETLEAEQIYPLDVYRWIQKRGAESSVETTAKHLTLDRSEAIERAGTSEAARFRTGDIALLAAARLADEAVVVTDDKPLRKTCKALSTPVSGSVGVLIRSVEQGHLDADEATDKLYAMDEVGARLSASLVKRAERLIEQATD